MLKKVFFVSRLCSENIAVLLSSSLIAMFAQFRFLPHKMVLRPFKTIMTCCMLLLLIMMNEWWWRWEQKWRKTLRQTDFRHTENIRSSCCNNIYTSRQNNLNYWLANSSIHESGFFSTQSKYIHSFFLKRISISLKELIIVKNGSKIADIVCQHCWPSK